jgi:beta-glucanase (GH16 family)
VPYPLRLVLAAALLLAAGGCAHGARPSPPAAGRPGQPVGQAGGWTGIFADEFDGAALDPARWADQSTAESDDGHGNLPNHQLEWNQAGNCAVGGGHLAMTARREAFTAPGGTRYAWTSCLLSTAASFSLRYGYVEERAILPGQAGFWPAFWTWQPPGIDRQIETDVYELHTAHPRQLLLTQHSGSGGGCQARLRFDPAAGWHTYGAALEPSGTTWYVDGTPVCRTAAAPDGAATLVSNLAVDGHGAPAPTTTTAVKLVDYIRAWRRG